MYVYYHRFFEIYFHSRCTSKFPIYRAMQLPPFHFPLLHWYFLIIFFFWTWGILYALYICLIFLNTCILFFLCFLIVWKWCVIMCTCTCACFKCSWSHTDFFGHLSSCRFMLISRLQRAPSLLYTLVFIVITFTCLHAVNYHI